MRNGGKSVLELGSFLDSSEGWEFKAGNRSELYEWVQKQLMESEYFRRGRKERGYGTSLFGEDNGGIGIADDAADRTVSGQRTNRKAAWRAEPFCPQIRCGGYRVAGRSR